MNGKSQFFVENTKQVNKIITITLAYCSLVLLALLATNWLGFFHFSTRIKVTIVVLGFFVTLGPLLLKGLKVPDTVMSYYLMLTLAVLIGMLGTNNGIGIYITYVLVPVGSLLYFDKKFTRRICVISYIIMAMAVYINCANKLEVRFLNWTHMLTFRNYMIGFTLEYATIMLFIGQIVRRTQNFLEIQEQNLQFMEKERDRQEQISAIYKKSIDENRKTAFEILTGDVQNLDQDAYNNLAAGHHFLASVQDTLMYTASDKHDIVNAMESVGEYFELDRISFSEPSPLDGQITLSYQWVRNERDRLGEYPNDFDLHDYEIISQRYDKNGYIELFKTNQIYDSIKDIECGFTRYIAKRILGAQLWLPTLSSGEYNGAFCFEKYDKAPFTTVEKFILSEIANTLAIHINRINSDVANQAKSEFLSTMSHEIRTPMNAIVGMTEVALREDMNDNVRKSLRVIKSSAEGLLGIINDILDFSKVESGKVEILPERYHIMSLANDVITIANARNIGKGLEIKLDIAEDMPSILKGDMVRIKQVMVNLITNAIKYTDEGSVTISISTEKNKNNKCKLKFAVTDTGQGIQEKDLRKIFKSFTQINQAQNRNVEGTGLGLAISKQLVELMGGKIGVSSEYGKGSTFRFELEQEIIDERSAGSVENYDYSTEDSVSDVDEDIMSFRAEELKVLIVDDNEINLMVAENLFAPFGMKITTASSGKLALEAIERETYDIIFMDHFMPEMDGVQTTRAIRALDGNPNQNTTIIALTADVVDGVKERLMAEGMNGFLAKPIDLKAAVKLLRKYRNKKIYG